MTSDEASQDMAILLSKTGTKSIAWDYFSLKKGADGKPVDEVITICQLCRKHVSAKYGTLLPFEDQPRSGT